MKFHVKVSATVSRHYVVSADNEDEAEAKALNRFSDSVGEVVDNYVAVTYDTRVFYDEEEDED